MKTQRMDIAFRRRRRGTAGVAVLAAVALLAACGGNGDAPGGDDPTTDGNGDGGNGSGTGADGTWLPNYVPVEYVEPDFPSVNGSTAGFTSIPELVPAFDSPPGSGGTYTAMTPLWGTIPPTTGNQYFDAVNEAIGTTIQFQISDGNTYGDRVATVLASPSDLADWVVVPSWNVPPRFGDAVGRIFEDLTPYVAGDAVEQYANLAAIPTAAWEACSWDGALYGIPMPNEIIDVAVFYRADLLPDADLPTDAAELIDFAVANTGDGRWGTNDLWWAATQMFRVAPEWDVDDAGQLVHRVETQEYRDALAWMAELYASGAVHPDAVADNSGDAKQRFESGAVVISGDGLGGWHESLQRMLPSNPDYQQQPLPVIAADGGEPVIWKSSPAGICSYIKQADEDSVRELLAAADFLASPFGTEEFQLVNYGVADVHYTLDEDGLPVGTELAVTEVQPTYIFLSTPQPVNARVQYPGFVEAYSTWMAEAAQYVHEPLFLGQNITEPSEYASLGQPFEDLEKDIARGRADLDDLERAVETWRSSGGEELRAFYQEIYDEQYGDANGEG